MELTSVSTVIVCSRKPVWASCGMITDLRGITSTLLIIRRLVHSVQPLSLNHLTQRLILTVQHDFFVCMLTGQQSV